MRRPRRDPRRLLTPLAALFAALAALAFAASAPAQTSNLRVAIPADDGSLTPYTFESGYAFMSLVYDSLMWRDEDGVARPWLARTVNRNATGRRINVRLRSGVRWHDGRRLTADDVVFTYAYMSRRQHPRFSPQLHDLVGVQAKGELNVEFVLRGRSLGFEDQPLADVPILPRHLWSGLPRNRQAPPGLPVGTGPYRLTRYDRGRSYRFDANAGYFRGKPSIARIDVPVIGRQDSIVTQLRGRRVDAVPLTVAPGTRTQRLTGVEFSPEVSYTGTMLLFNTARQPFRRLSARQAAARSLNLRRIAGNASNVAGGAVAADHGMLHPRSRFAASGLLHTFNPRAARIAFAEQGIGAFRVAVARNDPVRREAAQRVVRALADRGAQVTLQELSPAALDRALGRRGTRATFDAAVLGIPALASYDPSFLRAMFGTPRTSPLNDGDYRSPGFLRLADALSSALSKSARARVAEQQLRLLADELPAVPLLFGGGTIAYRPSVYDEWIGVRGTGILDKRSFLQGAAASRPSERAPAGDLIDRNDDDSFSLVPIIVGFVLLVAAAAAWWLRRSR
jgi:peptide/nickel transport system substrate-binding protein